MNRFQDFYNQQREWNGSSNQQHRKSFFNNARKERRTRTFDLFRGDIAAYEPEEIKPIPKITFRDTIRSLLRDKEKKVVKKIRPFVVGTVKHKIHSPPFLHGPLTFKEPKKRLISPMPIKSFAPMNYKFKAPKGLKMNLLTPLGEKKTVTSPFLLNTLWNKLDNKNTRRKNVMHENVTVRHCDKRSARLDSTPSSDFSTRTIPEANKNGEYRTAKKELWPEDQDDELVFGRLNLYRKQRSHDNLPKDDEKENSSLSQEKINHSVHPESSFNCEKEESGNLNIKNWFNSFNFASMTSESTKNPNANTSEASNKESIPNRKTTMTDYRVSEISPPKTIMSNTIFNLDELRVHTDIDNTILEEEDSSCSTLLVQNVFEITPKQVENTNDASTVVQNTMDEMVTLHCPLPTYNDLSEGTNDQKLSSSAKNKSLLMETTNIKTNATEITESLCNKTLNEKGTDKELLLDYQGTTIKRIDSTISPVQESSPTCQATRTKSMDSTIIPVQESSPTCQSTRTKSINSTISPVQESSPKYQGTRTESIDSTISPVQESSSDHDDSIIENNNSIASPIKKAQLDVAAVKDGQKVLNSTYTKFSVLLEEDENEENEEFEELQPNLEKSSEKDKRDDNIYSRPNPSILNSSNVNEQTVDSKNLCEPEHGLTSSDDTQKSINDPSENNNSSKDASPLSRSSLSSDCSDQTINAIKENLFDPRELPEKQFNEFIANSSSTVISNPSNPNKDDSLNSSSKTPVEIVPKINIEQNSKEISDDHSQEQESKPLTASSDSTSSNSSIITEAKPTEVNHEKAETNDNTASFKESCGEPKCNRLCCYVEISTPTRKEKEHDLTAKAQDSLDATYTMETVPNQIPREIQIARKMSSGSNVKFRVTSPTGLEQTLILIAADNEDARAGTVQSRESSVNVPVINLTDSPMEPVKKISIKSGPRRSTLDHKSPLLLSIQKRYTVLSSSDENEVVNLISDDEDDYTSFVHRVLKKYARTSNSPQQSPRSRTPLASIGNISRLNLSSRRTPQSPFANSPTKRTPVSLEKTVPMVHISPASEVSDTVKGVKPVKIASKAPVEKTQVIHDTPRKTPRKRNVVKELGTETQEVPSPLRVLNLRTRNISVSPSPKKMTPRKTPVNRKVAKEVATDVNEDVHHLRKMKLKEMNISASSTPKEINSQADTPRKTPIRLNVAKEVETEVNEDAGLLRVMNLRSRNISVSPSPKKMAPRRRKNNNQRV